MPRLFHHHDAEFPVTFAPWTEAVPAPVVFAIPRREPVAVQCGDGETVDRRPGEQVHELLVRAAKTHDTTGEPWRLVYAAPVFVQRS